MENYISVYKMDPKEPLKRVEIAQIKTDYMAYVHGIAVTEDYIVVYQNPLSFDVPGMMEGKDMEHCMKLNADKHAIVHAVKISDGTVHSIDTGSWSLTLHFGNAYQPDADTIVFTAPGFFDSSLNPFMLLDFDNLDTKEKLISKNQGARYSKYTLNLKDDTLASETLITYENGVGDVPNYNSKFMYKKNKYHYLLESWTPNTLDENYAWPIAKFDEESKKVVARWGIGKMVGSQEPRFIPNPNGTEEDDGLILTMARNFDTSTSSLYFIDPKTMTTL